MKLLIAADIFPPDIGGPATYVVTLANALVKDGWDVKIVSLNPKGEHVSRITYHVSHTNKFLKYVEYIWLLCKQGKGVDVIYAMGPVNAGLPALLVSWLFQKKFVVKVVGDYAWEQYQTTDYGLRTTDFVSVGDFQKMNIGGKVGWLKKTERYVVQRADKVIVPSVYLHKIVVDWGVKPVNIEVIYNAVDFKDVEPKNKPGAEVWIVSVARLMPWKGMKTLVEIMPDVLKDFPAVKLKIVGDGSEFSNLQSTVHSLRLEDSVELVGASSHDKTLSYIKTADVFVLNSGYEGLPHVVLEALMLRKIVCASNAGGIPEVIVGGITGFIFEYNNKEQIIKKIGEALQLEKREIPDSIYKNIKEKIEVTFSFPKMLTKTKRMIEEICEN